MNAKQLERASYLAAHAVLSANINASHLATPGARRSYTIDYIANTIRSVFELHCSALDESTDWWPDEDSGRIDPMRAGSQDLQLVVPETLSRAV